MLSDIDLIEMHQLDLLGHMLICPPAHLVVDIWYLDFTLDKLNCCALI